jgi:hypothetical protein
MQYHYVVGYDSDEDRWFIEYDPTAYFPDGNIWDQERSDSANLAYQGWYSPDDGSREEALDEKCWTMLKSLVPIWPSPVTNGEL